MSKPGQTGTVRDASLATLGLCFLVAMLEGVDLQAAGVAAPRLGPAFHMTKEQLGWFFSSSTFGLMLGAAVGGRLSDWLGRKKVLLGAIAAFGLMSLANGLAPDVNTLLLTRFLTGVGLGGALPNLLALVAENTPAGRRSGALTALYAGMPSGGTLISVVSLFGGANDWRNVFFAGGIGPLIMVPVLFFLLPDSSELQAVKADGGGEGLHPRGIAFALVGEGRVVRTGLLWVAFFLALVCMYILLNWLPTLLIGRGLSKPNASWVQVSFNLFGAIASVATGLLMDRLPLSKVAIGCFVGGAAGLVILWLAPVSLAISFVAGGLVGATISMTQAFLYAVAPPTYPTQVRGTGVGAAVAVGRLGSAAGPLLAGALLGSGAAPQQVLMLMVPSIVISGIAAVTLTALIGVHARTAIAGATVH